MIHLDISYDFYDYHDIYNSISWELIQISIPKKGYFYVSSSFSKIFVRSFTIFPDEFQDES